MSVPNQCAGCEKVEAIKAMPVKGFITRIEEQSGKQVSAWGRSGNQASDLSPNYVGFVGGGAANERDINAAWYGARGDFDQRDRQVATFCEGCPGILEATVQTGAGSAVVPICGKIALQAVQQ